MAAFEAWLVFLILVVNVVGELQRKRTLAASCGFLAAARLSCFQINSQHAVAGFQYTDDNITFKFISCLQSTSMSHHISLIPLFMSVRARPYITFF